MNQQTEQEEFPQLQLQIDPIKLKSHHQLNIENIPILFPQKPYEVQEKYMESVIKALNSQSNALLQSPTGTGKTLGLLCATLAWISQSKRKMRIIYSSRTHSQLKQVAAELSRTAYKPKVSMLGSRKHLCINDKINKLDDTILDRQCNKLGRDNRCQYYNQHGIEQAALVLQDRVLDIEELKKNVVCPFYLERQRNKDADITLLPYNYLLTINLKGFINLENSIIIFDEAHNVVQAADDGQSFSLSQEAIKNGQIKLDKWTDRMNKLGVIHEDYKDPSQIIKIALYLEKFYNHLGGLVNIDMFKSTKKKDEYSKSFDGIQIIKILSYYFSVGNKDTNYLVQLFDDNQAQILTEQEIDQFEDCCSKLHKEIFKFFEKQPRTKLKNILKFFSYVNNLFSKSKLMQNERQLIFSYKLIIKKASDEMHLSMICLDPSIGFSHLVVQKAYSIIITSGTLTPFDSWSQELGIEFKVHLENDHVDGITKNVKGFILREYNFSYNTKKNHPQQYFEQITSLGKMILHLCDIVPAGILVVFSSYDLMGKIKAQWSTTKILDDLHEKKPCSWEPRNGEELKVIFAKYKEDAKNKGAIFFCVQRGKVSEGIDFSDELCRAVFLVGVPNLPPHEVNVKEKRQFIDKQLQSFTGDAWYRQQATRATNQALGRVIRHKMDYGVIFLCDCKFYEENLSKWVRPSVKRILKLKPVHTKETQEFFKQKEFQYSFGQKIQFQQQKEQEQQPDFQQQQDEQQQQNPKKKIKIKPKQ